jgi:hypothetical protein
MHAWSIFLGPTATACIPRWRSREASLLLASLCCSTFVSFVVCACKFMCCVDHSVFWPWFSGHSTSIGPKLMASAHPRSYAHFFSNHVAVADGRRHGGIVAIWRPDQTLTAHHFDSQSCRRPRITLKVTLSLVATSAALVKDARRKAPSGAARASRWLQLS